MSSVAAVCNTASTSRSSVRGPLAPASADRLRAISRAVFGPSQPPARPESSEGVRQGRNASCRPSPPVASATFTEPRCALNHISDSTPSQLVVKGPARGRKGVLVCASRGRSGRLWPARCSTATPWAKRTALTRLFVGGEESLGSPLGAPEWPRPRIFSCPARPQRPT